MNRPLPIPVRSGVRPAAHARVQQVAGPLAGHPAPLGLAAVGAVAGDPVPTGTGPRARLIVPAGGRADLGTWAGAFPAWQWRERTGAERVRLRVLVDAVAVLTVLRSGADGVPQAVEKRLLPADEPVDVDVDVTGCDDGGLVWFQLQAGPAPVALLDAGWSVDVPARSGGVVIGTPTVGRVDDLVANLDRIAAAPDLVRLLARVVVVDHAPRPIEPQLRRRVRGLPAGLLRVVRQPNLGGSGGYARAMHEALAEPGADAVLLLDDDVQVDPEGLLRACRFAARTRDSAIVGLQMFDAARPGVLEAAAERIAPQDFWWTSAQPALAGIDLTRRPVSEVPALHARTAADFAGWWGSVVPLDAVRAVGYAMPLFLKWDDVEFALRAAAAGFATTSLTGAAVWHDSWRGKDDSRGWQAYFHARNRLVAALLHGDRAVRTGVLTASLLLEVKQLLALQAFAVERRHEGLSAVLDGPRGLGDDASTLDRLQRAREAADDQRRIPPEEASVHPAARAAVRVPRSAPVGGVLAAWALMQVLRHLTPPRRGPGGRLDGPAAWWEVPSYDDVLVPAADGAAHFRVRRDPRRFRALLLAGIALHVRLWWRWPALARRYRRAAPGLASPGAWEIRFRG